MLLSDRIIVSGVSLLQTMQACVGEITVLAIHDQALANSVDAVHIIGGLDAARTAHGFDFASGVDVMTQLHCIPASMWGWNYGIETSQGTAKN